MKIKGLLLGMFACAALVACTNDDIVENNNIEQPEKVKANLTLSISTSTGSGRAADAETGDDVENGTPSEGSIKDAVIIISPVQGNTATDMRCLSMFPVCTFCRNMAVPTERYRRMDTGTPMLLLNR